MTLPPRAPHPEASTPSVRSPVVLRAAAGDVARDRLLEVGLQLFAEQGFAKTSIRQIAQAAGTNVAAVSYYFGNKAGLYRAACWCGTDPSLAASPLPLARLADLFERMLAPLRSGGQARAWVKLQRREMLEPSGLWKEHVDRGIRPLHEALVGLLCARLGMTAPDDGLQALALLVIAPAVHLLLNCEVIDLLAPRLLENDRAVDEWCGRLVRHAELLIGDELLSRRAADPPREAVEAAVPGAEATASGTAAPSRPPRSPA